MRRMATGEASTLPGAAFSEMARGQCKVETMGQHRPGSRGLLLIAAFKLLKGLALLAVGIGVLRLLHRDVAAEVAQWIDLFRVDPDNIFIHRLMEKVSLMNDHRLRQLGIGSFVYAGLLLTEGVGLAFRKRWAEYLTIIMTASFVPLEVWQILRHTTWEKIAVLLVNLAIVGYLAWELRRGRSERQEA